jgi:hypothetical protein
MKIETKYNIGDIVYFRKGNRIISGVINSVHKVAVYALDYIVVKYEIDIGRDFKNKIIDETKLFSSVIELLNSFQLHSYNNIIPLQQLDKIVNISYCNPNIVTKCSTGHQQIVSTFNQIFKDNSDKEPINQLLTKFIKVPSTFDLDIQEKPLFDDLDSNNINPITTESSSQD